MLGVWGIVNQRSVDETARGCEEPTVECHKHAVMSKKVWLSWRNAEAFCETLATMLGVPFTFSTVVTVAAFSFSVGHRSVLVQGSVSFCDRLLNYKRTRDVNVTIKT